MHDVAELKAKLAGRRVVASVSGGKDSAALSLYLTELGIEHDRIFADTGWEHPETYAYLRGPLREKLGHIHEVKPALDMVALIRAKAMFPSRVRRFCTEELKVFPIARYLSARMDAGDDVINAVGIRAEESRARSGMPEWEWQDAYDCEVWRPLIAWTFEDVVAIHRRHGLAPNPLYMRGASRVGCWPCIYARKDEVRLVADTDPRRIDVVRELEAELSAAARARGTNPNRTFFQAGPVDTVVGWSRTAKGGENLALFGQPADEGCMRWGLCDTGGS